MTAVGALLVAESLGTATCAGRDPWLCVPRAHAQPGNRVDGRGDAPPRPALVRLLLTGPFDATAGQTVVVPRIPTWHVTLR